MQHWIDSAAVVTTFAGGYGAYKSVVLKTSVATAGKAVIKGTGRTAYDIAKEGGKHSGFYKQYINKSPKEITKGIQSIEKEIAEHEAKIANPEKYIPNFKKLDPRQQEALINKKWLSDIQRQQEQLNILKGIKENLK